MHRDDIERLLTSEELIEPSPGFAASVMSAVRREAAEVAPIAFPWRRVLPGLVLVAAGLVTGFALLIGAFVGTPASEPSATTWTAPVWLSAGRLWMLAGLAGSLLVSWLVVRLSRGASDTVL